MCCTIVNTAEVNGNPLHSEDGKSGNDHAMDSTDGAVGGSRLGGSMGCGTSISTKSAFHLCHLNPCSVCNKTIEIAEFITDNKLDVCAISETWLKGDARDNVILAELLPHGYKIKHAPRASRGGGVALIHKDSITLTRNITLQYQSFEHLEGILSTTPAL